MVTMGTVSIKVLHYHYYYPHHFNCHLLLSWDSCNRPLDHFDARQGSGTHKNRDFRILETPLLWQWGCVNVPSPQKKQQQKTLPHLAPEALKMSAQR